MENLGWRNNISYIPQKPIFLDTDLKVTLHLKIKLMILKWNEIIKSLNLLKLLSLFISDKKTIGDGAKSNKGVRSENIDS